MSFLPVRELSDAPSRTVAADADRTDIRRILARAKRTGGAIAYMTSKQAFYADVSDAPTYAQALGVIARANQQFELLPSEIRDRFANDPERFLAFMNDEANNDEIVKLGLRKLPDVVPEEGPVKVEIVNQPVDK